MFWQDQPAGAEVWRVGMGWSAHRKTLIFKCPASFSELINPCKLQRLASPISSCGAKKSDRSLPERLEVVV